VLRETTSRGPCGLVCSSRTSERGGEGYCVKEEGEKNRQHRHGRAGRERYDVESDDDGGGSRAPNTLYILHVPEAHQRQPPRSTSPSTSVTL
jgi:hypothetical protein